MKLSPRRASATRFWYIYCVARRRRRRVWSVALASVEKRKTTNAVDDLRSMIYRDREYVGISLLHCGHHHVGT